ncbi:alternative ribosome rescue aminoacyl-tRNA hydrolase ArfB [Devosia sp. XK-2]|uniref:alternative ribosome rescue aminoacyl-tRNA hydrolase ArfB n=1 Tax=Devosia sp. XK-2 TaxID=3126689 RepID=UPI0030D4FAB0
MAEPIHITRALTIDPSEIEESFVRGSGPGGQNVNKVASAVQLRFNLRENTSLPEAMKRRVAALAGSRLTKDGTIVITANAHRDQPLNRAEALERLVALLRAGVHPPKPRIATRPTLASKKRRLEKKTSRSSIKRLRSRPADTD